MFSPTRYQPANIARWPRYLLATLLTAMFVLGISSIASSAYTSAQNRAAEVRLILAQAAKLPLKDAAYFLWMEKSKLDKLEAPPKTEEDYARQLTRSSEEITAAIRYEHDHAGDGETFDRLKQTHPHAGNEEIKQAIIAGVKFNDDCFKYFSREPTDYDRRANDAIAMAKLHNPGYLPGTYKQARWWVTYLMK